MTGIDRVIHWEKEKSTRESQGLLETLHNFIQTIKNVLRNFHLAVGVRFTQFLDARQSLKPQFVLLCVQTLRHELPGLLNEARVSFDEFTGGI